MKKLFTFIALLFSTLTVMAADPVVVGEDNFHQDDASFAWDFNIDFMTQKFEATVDLSTCKNEGENVFSLGWNIDNWYSGKNPSGYIHCYYTAATKQLVCKYISVVNDDFGIWQYAQTLDDIEGDVTVDLSYQYGLRINGKQVYDAGQLKNVIIEKALRFGSKEGTSRSNATYKQARVVDAPFEAADAVNYNTYAMYSYKNQVSHFSNTTVGFKPSSLTTYDIILKNVTLNGQVLGNVTIKDVEAELMEGSGNNAKSYFNTTLKNGKAVLSNAGALAKELGLSDGAELAVDTIGGYVFNGNVSGTYKFLLGEDEVACYVGYDGFSEKEINDNLFVSFSSMDGDYADKTLVFSDFGDGYATIVLKQMRMASMGDTNMGDLTICEVPYTKNGADFVFDSTDLTATLVGSPSMALKEWTKVSLKGTVSGDKAYLQIDGEAYTMPIKVVFGKPLAEAKVYTDKMTVVNGSDTEERENATISVRDDGDGKYLFTITDVAGEDALSFYAEGTTDANGMVTYTANEATCPITMSGWEGYYFYISFSDAYSMGDKLYADMYVDMGGYGASYPDYAYYITFGDKNFTGINSVEATANAKTAQFFNVNGIRLSAPQKGLNIVRAADGKTYKQIVK